LAQSLVWSLVTVVPAIAVASWLRYEWYFSMSVGSLSLLVSWFSSQKKAEASLSLIEEFSYEPCPVKDAPSPPGNGQGVISLDITDRTERNTISMQFVNLPPSIGVEKFRRFCFGVVSGKSLARKNWTPESKLFSRDQFDLLVAELLSSGIVSPTSGKGNTLTKGGARALERYVWEVENVGKITANQVGGGRRRADQQEWRPIAGRGS